jgi:phage host-nuclease inhibitor protein Gam
MLLNEKTEFTDKEIIEKGSRALIKELGYSGFLRFIRYSEGINKEDYLKLEDELFKDMSLDEIYDNAKENWESNK